ncbi:MAG: M15 family metallopeptidase [Clostridia bacterium]|nr:M15 family metallopeptidase [Clostridia bacterium]
MIKRVICGICAILLAGTMFSCTKNTVSENYIPMPTPGGGSTVATDKKEPKPSVSADVNEEKTEEVKKEESENIEIKEEAPKQEEPTKEEPKKEEPVKEIPQPPIVEEPKTVPSANQQDGLTTIQREKPINKPETYTGDKYLLLVNPWNYLPADFKRNTRAIEGHYIDVGAHADIVQMLADMRKAGLSPYICSSTRTIEYQENLFNKRLKKNREAGLSEQEALDETAKWTAIPGTSEHHTGYALDIVSAKNTVLNESQENTPEQKWLMAHCHEYGFILRYPKGKTDVTGIYYEPWHYRYVGKEAAAEMHEKGADYTFEEYVEFLKANGRYNKSSSN